MSSRAVLLLALAGCPAKHAVVVDNVVPPVEGTALAVYLGREPGSTIAIVDDRRRLTVANGTLALERVDPSAQVLLIEGGFNVGACTRERKPGSSLDELARPRPQAKQGQPQQPLPVPPVLAPILTCKTDAAPGTYLVRVVQRTPLPSFKTFHVVTYAGGDQAKVSTRFSFTTLSWAKQAASLEVLDGLPGGEVSPKPIARSTLALDGTITTLAIPETSAPARLRTVYDGAIRDPVVAATELAWGRESRSTVMSVLELDGLELATGQIDVHFEGVELRDTVVMPKDRERVGTTQRLGLETVPTFRANRRATAEFVGRDSSKKIRQKIMLSVTNLSDKPQPISLEEVLRPRLKRQVTDLPPTAKVVGDVVRADLVVEPRATVSISFTVHYNL